jgi:hypothetical protein
VRYADERNEGAMGRRRSREHYHSANRDEQRFPIHGYFPAYTSLV